MALCTTQRIRIPAPNGRHMKLLILRPTKNARPREETPAILWLHGGGYISGMPAMAYMTRVIHLVKKYGAVVVSPAYRLAPLYRWPAALEDSYAALLWLKNHATTLGADPSRLFVGGESAGGGLTAALCMYARDRGEVNVAYQMPLYPMLDDRDTDSSRNNHAPVWNTFWNHIGWNAYLGKNRDDSVSPYAAPARQTDYAGLPPAYTFVGDIEPFYCETLTFVENLRAAGVDARVDVYPGCFHAFDMLPFHKYAKPAAEEFERQYLHAAGRYVRRQPE